MTTQELERARFNMIEQQIRPTDVSSPEVLDTLAAIPREVFVPRAYSGLAFADIPIPLGLGEYMMTPILEGKLLQALQLNPQDRVLEVGTGSGYLTACLARLAGRVTSLEIHPEFTHRASDNLERLNISGVEWLTGDFFTQELPSRGYSALVFTGSLPQLPEKALQLLDDGGRLFAVLGTAPIMKAVLATRLSDGSLQQRTLFETLVPPLQAPQPAPLFEL